MLTWCFFPGVNGLLNHLLRCVVQSAGSFVQEKERSFPERTQVSFVDTLPEFWERNLSVAKRLVAKLPPQTQGNIGIYIIIIL